MSKIIKNTVRGAAWKPQILKPWLPENEMEFKYMMAHLKKQVGHRYYLTKKNKDRRFNDLPKSFFNLIEGFTEIKY